MLAGMGSTLRTLAIEGCPSTHQPLSGHLFPPPSSRGPTVHSERVVSIAPAPLPLTSQRVCHTLAEKRCGPPSADLQMRGKKWEVLCSTPAALRPPPPPPPPPPLPPPLCTLEILTTFRQGSQNFKCAEFWEACVCLHMFQVESCGLQSRLTVSPARPPHPFSSAGRCSGEPMPASWQGMGSPSELYMCCPCGPEGYNCARRPHSKRATD